MALTQSEVVASLQTTRDYWLTVMQTLASDAATNGIKVTYGVGGQNVSWAEAYKTAQEMVEKLTQQINAYWSGPVVQRFKS